MCGEAGGREPQGGGSSEGAGIRRGARRGTTSEPLAWGPSWLPSPPQVHSPLGSSLSFHLPLIPIEAGLTQEPPKQGPEQCHTPARTPLTVATWGFTPFTPLDTSPWAEPTGGSTRGSRASLRGAECHPSSQTQSLVELSPQGPAKEAGGYRSTGHGGRKVGLERWGIPSPGCLGHIVLPAPQVGAFAGEAELAARLQGAHWWPQTCSHPEL